MNNEEKILEMLVQLNTRMDKMQASQNQMQAAQTQMQADIADLKEAQSAMQTTLTRVALTQENIVLKSLDALAEGQDLTHQRMKDLVRRDELAELRDEVRLMRTVIAQHSKDIEELKAVK